MQTGVLTVAVAKTAIRVGRAVDRQIESARIGRRVEGLRHLDLRLALVGDRAGHLVAGAELADRERPGITRARVVVAEDRALVIAEARAAAGRLSNRRVAANRDVDEAGRAVVADVGRLSAVVDQQVELAGIGARGDDLLALLDLRLSLVGDRAGHLVAGAELPHPNPTRRSSDLVVVAEDRALVIAEARAAAGRLSNRRVAANRDVDEAGRAVVADVGRLSAVVDQQVEL